MAKLCKPWSVMELGVLEHGLRLGVSIEVIADFITRDAHEVRQKADQLGILPHWKRLPEKFSNDDGWGKNSTNRSNAGLD
jgi:hypothetical protein